MTNVGTFLPAYTAEGILPADPFQVLTVAASFFTHTESGPLRVVHLSRHKWPEGLVNAQGNPYRVQVQWY